MKVLNRKLDDSMLSQWKIGSRVTAGFAALSGLTVGLGLYTIGKPADGANQLLPRLARLMRPPRRAFSRASGHRLSRLSHAAKAAAPAAAEGVQIHLDAGRGGAYPQDAEFAAYQQAQ